MDLYKAEVLLFKNNKGEWDTKFTFELQDADYEVYNDILRAETHNGWVVSNKNSEEKLSTFIPSTPWVSRELGKDETMRAFQGFDRKLSQEELEELRQELDRIVRKNLELHFKTQKIKTQKIIS